MMQYKYFTAHSNEKVYAIIHRHWFNITRQYIPIIAIIVALMFVVAAAHTIATYIVFQEFEIFLYFLVSFVYIVLWLYAFFIWVDYHLDIWVITSWRIINIEQKGFFSRVESELDYTHIQDVSSEIHGIIHTLFNYGDVVIQTAGTEGKFIFRNVPQPEKIKTLIIHLHRQALAKRAHPQHIADEMKNEK